MATVRINRYAAESGQMPRKCICCGADATQHVRHTFYYQPAWMVLFYILLPRWVKWALSSDPITASVPVCMSHTTRLKWPTYVGYLFLAGVVLLVPAMIFATYSENDSLIGVFGMLLFLFAVAIWIGYVAVALLTPRAVQYTSSTITFGAVAAEFAHAAGNTASTSTKAPSAGIPPHLMPGYRPTQGTSGAKLALYIVGGGMAVVLLGCCGLPVLGALVRAVSSNVPRQVAQQPPPDFGLPPQPNFTPPPPSFAPPPSWSPPTPVNPAFEAAPDIGPTLPPSEAASPPATPPSPSPFTPPFVPEIPPRNTFSDFANSATASDAQADPAGTAWNAKGQFVTAKIDSGLAKVYPAGTEQVTRGMPLAPGAKVWCLFAGAWRCNLVDELLGPDMVLTHDALFEAQRQPFQRRDVRVVSSGATPPASAPSSDPEDGSSADTMTETAGGALTESTPRVEANVQSGQPTQFPTGSSALRPTTKLKPGDTVWTLWGQTWYPSSVVQAQARGPVKIHYFGYSDGFDEVLPRERLRLPARAEKIAKSPAKSSGKSPTSAVEPMATSVEEPAVDPAPSKSSVMRTWTDVTGKFKIEAKLLEVVNGKARLEKADGKVISLPLDKLSPADRAVAEGGGE